VIAAHAVLHYIALHGQAAAHSIPVTGVFGDWTNGRKRFNSGR
jgi:hypothetical protein